MFLGLIPNSADKAEWVTQLREYRCSYYKKLSAVMAFKEQMMREQEDLQTLDSLRWATTEGSSSSQTQMDSHQEMQQKDKELRELITQDVDRTMQEQEFFTEDQTKEQLSNILYLWAKDNVDFGYRQGMNEVLAILVIALCVEVTRSTKAGYLTQSSKCSESVEQITASDSAIIDFIFSEHHVMADIYWCFDRMMQFGIKNLYQVTKDVSQLKAEICARLEMDHPANSQKNEPHQMSQIIREKLEKAYEEEKQKSVIVKKCSRIYHEILKSQDERLYKHLMDNQVSPELQLMRWLRCVLSREFCVDSTLHFWDFILGGVYLQHTAKHQSLLASPSKDNGRISDSFPPQERDPFLNLDILCVSMIVQIRKELLESDFSMCLALMLSYEEPDDPSELISQAIAIKKKMRIGSETQVEESKGDNPDDLFDFEMVETADQRRNAKKESSLERQKKEKARAAAQKKST